MPQHITIRVPWHDHGWDGTVCAHPESNNACLRLKNIAANKNDLAEVKICGECMAAHADELSCIGEGVAFMSPVECVRSVVHPYKHYNNPQYQHFLPTQVHYPAYSFPARPFAWLMMENIERISETYHVDYRPEREPVLEFNNSWIQQADNHKAVFEAFYRDVQEGESLCIAYAKQVPFVEDPRRVVVAVGRITKLVRPVEHNRSDENGLRCMTWETMVCHSIREDHADGFVIPYQQMMEYAEQHPGFDMSSITVFAPDDAFDEFSYATEHVSHDAVIDVLQSCIRAFEIINDCLDEDYSNVLMWLNEQLNSAWEDRGAFPGLGAMLCAMEVRQGILIARQLKSLAQGKTAEDLWQLVDRVFSTPESILEPFLSAVITPILKKTWRSLTDERRTLFKLLSRFSLTIEQASVLFNGRTKHGIDCADRDIIDNPYILYEKTRLKQDALFISVRKVDRAVFPVPSIRDRFPLASPTRLSSENDQRRVRAIAVSVLENASEDGHTILPCDMLVDRIRESVLDPQCRVTLDIMRAISSFLSAEIIQREMKDGTKYYKLVRINAFDAIIEKRIKRRMKASRLEVDANWRELVDQRFAAQSIIDEEEEKARTEKAAVLAELAAARISVLIGDAGTGKTTVLSVLCNQRQINAGGVLLLAPTGKATVRLFESVTEGISEEQMARFEPLNVAQFLIRSGRFDSDSMRYQLAGIDAAATGVPKTVIIDEASMLTEEMFGALMQALKSAERIIFVGDPNQLPPIGPGRPFVDLVTLLKRELQPGVFPRVCRGYGELTKNRRQRGGEGRMDVALSKLFTTTEQKPDESIIDEIVDSEDPHIAIRLWSTKEELEELLLSTMAEEIGMNGIGDQEGFDISLGGTRADQRVFFNLGCASAAERWQILAPVRNMPHGVMNINRMIHTQYRSKLVELSHRKGYKQFIPEACGPESIVYGDKVINVVNGKRRSWPANSNYVANGEIGVACPAFSSKVKDRVLEVEFSTQPGTRYKYRSGEFGDDGQMPPLELAYALTVHKAQGSQFGTVILVLSEPCLLISRELLYTALTRQKERIVILYNQEAFKLLRYSAAENSTISKRYTDLFADVYTDGACDMRPQVVQVGNAFYEERLVHRTARGELVRSKSEVIIANALFYHDLEYAYEPEIVLDGRMKRPDFQITDGDTGEVWYWEHCGILDDPVYRRRWEQKKAYYKKHGIEEGKNLIVTFDEKGTLDSRKIEEIIEDIFE